MYTSFISPEELQYNINNPNWRIFDCRYQLDDSSWGFEEYNREHIPNAIYAQLNKDLARKPYPGSGRHPMPLVDDFVQTCSAWGIEENTQVVVYDHLSGAFAARLWWLLRYHGHNAVAILDGGFNGWKNGGLPTEAKSKGNNQAQFKSSIQDNLLVTVDELEEKLHSEKLLLIDARAELRYQGIEEPIDKIAGHIPSAVNQFHQNNLNQDGFLKDRNDLLDTYTKLAGGDLENKEIIAYCGSGVTSCLDLAVVHSLGFQQAKLYLGSWSEWIEDPYRPKVLKS